MNRSRLPREIDVFAKLREDAPPRLLEFLDQALVFFPEEFRYRLKQVIDTLPKEGDNMQKILEVVRAQWKDIQSERLVQIAVTGPSQTGKTSLLSAILQKKARDADPIFTVVETPGLEEYLGYGSDRTPPELAEADLIVLVLDARFGVSELTQQILEKLRELKTPILVVLNKIDLVDDPSGRAKEAKRVLRSSVFSTSIHDPVTLDNLLKAMVTACPKALYPLAQSFPKFRSTLCRGIITQASFAVGLVGVIPIPVSDLLPNTAIQTAMILKIARAFGCELNRNRARELLPMLTAGVLARQLGHALRQKYPRQKKFIGVMLGGSFTYLMGRVAVSYFESTQNVLRSGNLAPWDPLPDDPRGPSS
ncbi:MAG TPA: GTP-binding protein [Acidobacteriota bacterium]|nr:GTP-binding protein [Acidobacteriota bacterium]